MPLYPGAQRDEATGLLPLASRLTQPTALLRSMASATGRLGVSVSGGLSPNRMMILEHYDQAPRSPGPRRPCPQVPPPQVFSPSDRTTICAILRLAIVNTSTATKKA
jgi:hypothetical protein